MIVPISIKCEKCSYIITKRKCDKSEETVDEHKSVLFSEKCN